jgi:glycosyltransferase involved in cell wall biosynthesis
MKKKKILWVNEASWKNTGYSVYGKEVLTRLNQVEEFEIAELACYATQKQCDQNPTPWKKYANKPEENSQEFEAYVKSPSRIFGEHKFNEVCLDFQPDIVMDIRDWWMIEYQQRSPFRDFFHWSIMPTVDASPQNTQWINTFASADSLMTYSEFGMKTLKNQCDSLNIIGVASPAASNDFYPIANKKAHKDAMGLESSAIIIGTVMRNQRRKLYPDLFKDFRKYLDLSKNPDVFLYCHTYYPDIGWEIPQLVDEFGLNNRVLFSYKCTKCKSFHIDFFKDSITYCPNCKNFSNKLVGIDNPIDQVELNKIYNVFDIYVQYANSEGFGMPQLEAAYAGLPVIATNYSAMESVIKNIDGIAIEPLSYTMECETGCYRAIPDGNMFVEKIMECINNPRLKDVGLHTFSKAKENYNWDKTAQIWIDYFKTIEVKDINQTWKSAPRIRTPKESIPDNIQELSDQVSYLFNHVLHKPEWIGGYLWAKTIKDCTFGYRVHNSEEDYYFNESHIPNTEKYQKFDYADAAKDFTALRNQWNEWEKLRGEINGKL